MSRILLLIAFALVFVPTTIATTNEVLVEKATVVGRLAKQLESLVGFLQTNEVAEPSDTDTVLDPQGKPVYKGTKKVGFDKGELDDLDNAPPSNGTNATQRVVATKFFGHKHKPIKNAPEKIDLRSPTVYEDRIAYRKARKIMADVMSEFPDKYHDSKLTKDVELSVNARCVDSDPYDPNWKNPIGLKNPTPMRKYARVVLEKASLKASTENLGLATADIKDATVNVERSPPKEHSTEVILENAASHKSDAEEQNTIVTLDAGMKEMAEIIKRNQTINAINNLEKLQKRARAQEAAEDAQDEKDAKEDENPSEDKKKSENNDDVLLKTATQRR